MRAFHGLAAYSQGRNPLAIKAKIDSCIGVEICCADRPIGAIGAVVEGECSYVFERDVWSTLDQGERVAGQGCPDYIYNPTQKQHDDFCRAALKPSHGSHYCESWITPELIQSVWVKAWASDTLKKVAAILAKNRGVPLIVVDGQSRIWEIDTTIRYKTGDFINSPKIKTA